MTTRQHDACSAKFGTGAEPWRRLTCCSASTAVMQGLIGARFRFGLVNFFFSHAGFRTLTTRHLHLVTRHLHLVTRHLHLVMRAWSWPRDRGRTSAIEVA